MIKTKEQIKIDFLTDLKVLFSKYNAELTAEDH